MELQWLAVAAFRPDKTSHGFRCLSPITSKGSFPKKPRNKVENTGMFLSFVKGVIKGANFQIPAVSCWVVYVSGENLPAIYWEQNSGGSIHQAVNCTCGKCMAIRNTVLAKLFKPSHEKSTYKLCYRRYHCEILWILQTWIKRWIIHTYFQVERFCPFFTTKTLEIQLYDFVTGSSPEVLFLPIISEDFCIWETSRKQAPTIWGGQPPGCWSL